MTAIRKKNKTKDEDQHVKTYTFHGIDIAPSDNGEAVGVCPFCGGDKFYVNRAEGLFSCKSGSCSKSGNKYTFLQLFYEEALSVTETSSYKHLSTARGGIPYQAFQSAELAYDPGMERWLIPIRSESGSIVNLRVWDDKTRIPKNTSGCKIHPFNLDSIKEADKIYVCEGEWDAIALQWLLTKLKKIDLCAVICVPGSDMFREEWAVKFHGKEVVLLYDHDAAGKKGMDKAVALLQSHGHCKSIETIEWPDTYPDKYDISDLIAKNTKTPKAAFRRIHKYLEDHPTRKKRAKKDVSITNFSGLSDYFKKFIHVSDDSEDGLLLICSAILSNQISGEPLWLFLVGPPGGGKTLLLQSFANCDDVHFESSLGAKTLISGFKTQDGSDPSLLPRLIGKTLILKDYTELMSKPAGEQEEIYGQLRGAYDGHVHRSYASGIVREYPSPDSPHDSCRFSILAGVTNAIHGDNRAALGERFLKFQMVGEGYDPVDQVRHAIDNSIKQEIPEDELQDATLSFVEHLLDSSSSENMPPIPKWYINRIVGLSQLVATVRATVDRKGGELSYRPTPEVGTRLSKQLIKLSQCVAVVLGKKTVDRACYSLIAKVAMDTCFGWHRDVILAIAANPDEQLERFDIANITDMSPTTTKRVLDDLIELRAVRYTIDKNSKRKGQPPRVWKLTKSIENLISLASFRETHHLTKLLDTYTRKAKPKKHIKPKRKFSSTKQ